jgi:hypothetical protein
MKVANTLAYYHTATVSVIKSTGPWLERNCMKDLMSQREIGRYKLSQMKGRLVSGHYM